MCMLWNSLKPPSKTFTLLVGASVVPAGMIVWAVECGGMHHFFCAKFYLTTKSSVWLGFKLWSSTAVRLKVVYSRASFTASFGFDRIFPHSIWFRRDFSPFYLILTGFSPPYLNLTGFSPPYLILIEFFTTLFEFDKAYFSCFGMDYRPMYIHAYLTVRCLL